MRQRGEAQKGGRSISYGFDTRGLPETIKSGRIIDLKFHFDTIANLEYRIDNIKNQQEYFEYDALNRLKLWAPMNGKFGGPVHTIDYNAVGNITKKDDLGNFTFAYGEGNGKPHALTSISGVPTNFPQPTTTYPLADLAVTYTDFKKIKTLNELGKSYELTYGVDDQRRKSVYRPSPQGEGAGGEVTRYYLDDYEEEKDAVGNIRQIHYLSGAILIKETNKPDKLYYSYSDYQGSLIALTDKNGTVVERYAYDPWGARRNPNDWTQKDARTSWIVNRGYTGHEHLDAFGIINMNGRIYDPVLARFLSPDPYVQAPDFTQSFNRYAYCINNPFKYTDPTGEVFGWDDAIVMIVGGTINLISNWHDGITWGEGLTYFGIGAGAGIASYYAPGAATYFAAGAGVLNNLTSQSFQPDGSVSFKNLEWNQVAYSGVMSGATSYLGGQFGKTLGADKWFKGIDSPLLQNVLRNVITNTIVGGTFGGFGALADNDPNTTFESGAWSGFKMGVVSGTISGIGAASIYSTVNDVNLLTGKYNKPLYHYTTTNKGNLIMDTQLGLSDDSWVYLTPDGSKTPLQAQLDLALPQSNDAQSLIMVKPNSIYPENFVIQRNVTGNVFNRPGGGYEIIYKGIINTNYLWKMK